MHVESISLLLPFFHPSTVPSVVSLSSSHYLRFLLLLRSSSCTWRVQPSPLREGKRDGREASHPDNEDPRYPVQIFSSVAVCTGTNKRAGDSIIARRTYLHIYASFCAGKSWARASVLVDSASSIIPARLDNEFMRDHPSENFMPSEMQTQNSRRWNPPRRERDAILLVRTIFILSAIIPRKYVSLDFLSAALIVFADHVRREIYSSRISLTVSIEFYGSMFAVNSYVYELIRRKLITITNLRATGTNKFQSPAEIEIVVISTSLIFDAANVEKFYSASIITNKCKDHYFSMLNSEFN
jgi:hypothetical protein